MGGLIGYLQVQEKNVAVDVTIKDCSNATNVTAEAREAGGILGLAQFSSDELGTIGAMNFENCTNSGNIVTQNGGGVSCAGGILGWENTLIYKGKIQIVFTGCKNEGRVVLNGENKGEQTIGYCLLFLSRIFFIIRARCLTA